MNKGKILICGAGATACLFAVQLVEAGYSISMLDEWKLGVEVINRDGISLLEEGKSIRTVNPSAFTILEKPVDCNFAIVLLKTWQTRKSMQMLAGKIPQDAVILTLQNGIGNRETIQSVLPAQPAEAGIMTVGASLESPGVVRKNGELNVYIPNQPMMDSIHNVLMSAGFQVHIEENIDRMIWQKLILNCALNPLTALYEKPNGFVLEDEKAFELMRKLVDESLDVAKANGYVFQQDFVLKMISDVVDQTKGNYSSMLQDVRRKAQTELAYLNGKIVMLAEKHGMSVPTHEWVINRLQSKYSFISGEVNADSTNN